MTCFVLIRHGETDHTGRSLSGRAPGIGLNAQGRMQAETLPQRLAALPPDLICSSPLDRCVQTAAPLARAYGLQTHTLPDFVELHYGKWQGRDIASLGNDGEWQHYNLWRSVARIPGGDRLLDAQYRMLNGLELLCREAADATVAVVSHSDPLKALLAYLLGMPLDMSQRLRLSPASISVVSVGRGAPLVHCINCPGILDRSVLGD